MQTLLVYINVYCNVPNQKTSEVLGFLSDDRIKISPATVLNTVVLETLITEYVKYYNAERPSTKCGRKSPVQFRTEQDFA